MVYVNGKEMEWHPKLSFDEVLKFLGYRIKSVPVVIRVNGKVVRRAERDSYKIPDEAQIDVIKALGGG